MQFASILHQARMTMLEWMIIRSVPFLNRFRRRSHWLHPLAELRQLPAQTWGAQLAHFLDARHFDDFLPNYETHDAFHALLDYDTNVVGEMRLQAFMIGNQGASLPGRILFVLGCLLMPDLWSQLRCDYFRGRLSASVRQWDVPEMLTQDIATVRSQIAACTTLV